MYFISKIAHAGDEPGDASIKADVEIEKKLEGSTRSRVQAKSNP